MHKSTLRLLFLFISLIQMWLFSGLPLHANSPTRNYKGQSFGDTAAHPYGPWFNIGILTQFKSKEWVFLADSGQYVLKDGTYKLMDVPQKTYLIFRDEGGQAVLYLDKDRIGPIKEPILYPVQDHCRFKLRSRLHLSDVFTYPGGLVLLPQAGFLAPVNVVRERDYLAGVVESEGGHSQERSYLEVQAVLARTYLFRNINKHWGQGFQLCDKTHCQMYQGMSRFNPMILPLIDSTHRQVVVDQDGQCIDALYHANCGGRTLASEEVWSLAVPYLRPVTDSFCLRSHNACWSAQFLWEATQKSLFKNEGWNRFQWECLSAINPDKKWISCADTGFSLPMFRQTLGLPSTWFSASKKGDLGVLDGRGNGHRVGLCQEGAMEMARRGFTFNDILRQYYTGTRLFIMPDSLQNSFILPNFGPAKGD